MVNSQFQDCCIARCTHVTSQCSFLERDTPLKACSHLTFAFASMSMVALNLNIGFAGSLRKGIIACLGSFMIIKPSLSCNHSLEFVYIKGCHDVIFHVSAIGSSMQRHFFNWSTNANVENVWTY